MNESTNRNSIIINFYRMPRFAPAIFSAFLCGLLLLFIRELGQNLKSFLIPSLVVYALGSALIGAIHRLLALSYQEAEEKIIEENKIIVKSVNNEKTIPTIWKVIILIVHLIWFCALVLYLVFRCVL